MDTFYKYQIRVSAVKDKREIEVFVDLFSKSSIDFVTGIVNSQVKRHLKFPVRIEVNQLAPDAFLFQAVSTPYQVVDVVAADFANILWSWK